MAAVLIVTTAFIILCEGTGACFLRILGIARKGFSAPAGFALILSVLQLFSYYPEQLNARFGWMIGFFIVVLLLAVYMCSIDFKELKQGLLRWESLVAAAAAIVFTASCPFSALGNTEIPTAISHELFSDVVLQQGVFNGLEVFRISTSYLMGLLSLDHLSYELVTSYGMGLLYTILSTMLIINIVRSFHLRNHWLEFSLLFYLLIYGNYQTWHVATASQGTSFSVLFITMACFACYRYLKEGNEQIKYCLIPILGAGLASHGSFALASIAILYGLTVYLFSIRKVRSLFDLTTLLIPHVIYWSAMLQVKYGWIIVVCYLIFFFRRYKRPLRKWISRSEEWMFDHYKKIFLIIIPVIFAAASLILVFFFPGTTVDYGWYFHDFYTETGVRDYLLLHSNALDIFLNILRWSGVVLLFINAKLPEDRWMRFFLFCVFILFLNPLCTPALVALTGPQLFRLFSLVFNPLSETVIFLFLYKLGEWNVIGEWILEIGLCLAGGAGLYVLFVL